MIVEKPTSLTDPNGDQVVNDATAQGKKISDGSLDVMVYGQLTDQAIGLQFNDTSNERVFMGRDADGSYIFKFSQPGFDARTADDEDLVMSSGFNMFNIVQSGTLVVPTNSATGTTSSSASVTHGLGYVPAFLAFSVDLSGRYQPLPIFYLTGLQRNVSSPANGFHFGIDTYAQASASSSIFRVDTAAAHTSSNSSVTVPAFSVKYFLLRETAN